MGGVSSRMEREMGVAAPSLNNCQPQRGGDKKQKAGAPGRNITGRIPKGGDSFPSAQFRSSPFTAVKTQNNNSIMAPLSS